MIGIKCPPPPLLPPNYVYRPQLLDETVSKLCQSIIGPNSYGTSLTVTGAGGFGKTSLVTGLCYHPVITKQFTDGVVFIELGPQATDPSMKLSQLYHLLTGQYLKQGDINHTAQEINELTSLYYRNVLVIIYDVWHVEDAEPIVQAFSNCKIILTTRMNDIEQYIPTKQIVTVGPMEQTEAISLLTNGVIDVSQLSQEDAELLNELTQDVHLWPLLVSLVRGQLSHNMRHHCLTPREAIQIVQAKLYDKGLTAFDKNNVNRSRRCAVKVCIEVTLELLTKVLSDKIKMLILWTGIGTSLQTAVLHNLWNISEQEARYTVDALWAFGLVQFSDVMLPLYSCTQHHVEVHAVISRYIIQSMESIEVSKLSPFGRLDSCISVLYALTQHFRKSFGVHDMSPIDCLKFKLGEIEYFYLPFLMKFFVSQTAIQPHVVIVILENIKNILMSFPNNMTFFPSSCEEIDLMIDDCHKILKDIHKDNRKLNQNFQQCIIQRNYTKIIQVIQAYNKNRRIYLVTQQAVAMVEKIIPYCESKMLHMLTMRYERLMLIVPDYDYNTIFIMPTIKIFTKHLHRIETSLQAGSPYIDITYYYIKYGKYDKDLELCSKKCAIKLQEVAPNFVHQVASDSGFQLDL